MKLHHIIIASSIAALAQGAFASEVDSFPEFKFKSNKTRAEVVGEYAAAKAANQLPAQGDHTEPARELTKSGGKTRVEVRNELLEAVRTGQLFSQQMPGL